MNIRRIIDANVILRYVLQDNENDFNNAKNEILKGVITNIAVIAEVVYVLKGVYKIPREQIAETLITLSEEIEYEDNDIVISTLINYRDKNIDLIDCYLLARNKTRGDEIVTFDKKLNKELAKK